MQTTIDWMTLQADSKRPTAWVGWEANAIGRQQMQRKVKPEGKGRLQHQVEPCWGEPEVQQRTQRLTDRKLTLGCEFPLWKYNLQPGSISVTSKRRIWVIIGKNFQQCLKNLCFSWFWFGVGRFSVDWRTISASTLVINVLKADPTYAGTAIIITITAFVTKKISFSRKRGY